MSTTAAHVQVLTERRLIAEWLVAIGYPCDYSTEPPLPEPFRWGAPLAGSV